jgi:alkylation response protein AidB-like acyl-CoA dehydrogenase
MAGNTEGRKDSIMKFEMNEDQQALLSNVRYFAERELAPTAFDHDDRNTFQQDRLKKLASQGLLGISISPEYGGAGLSVVDSALVIEELALHCPMSASLATTSSIGQAGFVAEFASPTLRERLLPAIVRGESFVSIVMSEPDAGSAVTAMKSTAVKDGDSYVINGMKHYVSWADLADLYIVYARFDPSQRGASGIGAILVERDTPGISLGRASENMSGEPQHEVILEDCRVPAENLLMAAGGFGRLTQRYNYERVGGTARNLGVATLAFNRSVEYLKERQQFDRPLSDFQGLQWMLADMAISLDAARLLLYRAADAVERGDPLAARYTSMAKIAVVEWGKEVCDMAIQLHGAPGYLKDLPLEYLYRLIRGASIAGGTTQIHRNTVAASILGIRNSQWKS